MRSNDRIRQESLPDSKGDRHTAEVNKKNEICITGLGKDRYYSDSCVLQSVYHTIQTMTSRNEFPQETPSQRRKCWKLGQC